MFTSSLSFQSRQRLNSRLPLFALITLFIAIVWSDSAGATDEGEEIGAGQIRFQSVGSSTSALHLGSEVVFSVNGFIAHVELTQRFKNQTDAWQEALYLLPMNQGAAVQEMEMQIGDRVIRAEIKEKQAAKKIYNAARKAGKKASLVQQARPNLFRQSVANIAPHEEIVVRLKFVQPVDYDNGRFSLRFPMTLTPRFNPTRGNSPGALATGEEPSPDNPEARPLAAARSGWVLPADEPVDSTFVGNTFNVGATDELLNPIAIRVALNPGLPLAEVSSSYHSIAVSRHKDQYEVLLDNGPVSMDRDFVLNWIPVPTDTPQAAVFRESLSDEDYVLLMLLPPTQRSAVVPLTRDVVFVIDTSGSMSGVSITQAKASLQRALKRLRPGDRFNVVAFNESWQRLFDDLESADPFLQSMADQWVDNLAAGGGTNIQPALEQAIGLLQQVDVGAQQLQQIVFITDGAVGNEAALFELIHQQIGDIRLFPVSIGSAPNSYFMERAARFGRGAFTHIGSLQEVESNMDLLLEKIDAPVATNITISWPGEVESYPERLPTLYQGEPLIVVAKAHNLQGEVHISGATASMPWLQTLDISGQQSRPGVGTLWARRKIASLEDQRVREGATQEIRQAMIDVAIQHKIVSRHTSLVAVEETVSRPRNADMAKTTLANQLPHGQQMQFPKTATSSTLLLLMGLLMLGFGLLGLRFVAVRV